MSKELKQKVETLLSEKKEMVVKMEKRLLELEKEYQETYSDNRTENMRIHLLTFKECFGERKRNVKELEELINN